MVDEIHATIPQIGGMYEGDRSRKTALVEYGFRLPSALDNRPLKFKEFMEMTRADRSTSARRRREFEIENSVVGNTGYIPHKRERIGEDEAGARFAGRGGATARRPARNVERASARSVRSSAGRDQPVGRIRCRTPGRAARGRADHPADRIARSEDHR